MFVTKYLTIAHFLPNLCLTFLAGVSLKNTRLRKGFHSLQNRYRASVRISLIEKFKFHMTHSKLDLSKLLSKSG